MIQKVLLICLYALSVYSCTPSELAREEYVKYIEDENNGLKIREEQGAFVFILQYKPVEYMAVMEQRDDTINQAAFAKTKEELSNLDQFNLTIESKDGKNEMLKTQIRSDDEYFRRIEYFSMAAEKDFQLIQGNDTIPCALYHFERSYDITPYSKIVLGFKKPVKESNEDWIISFNESILGIGKLNFRIKNKNINNIPQLGLQK